MDTEDDQVPYPPSVSNVGDQRNVQVDNAIRAIKEKKPVPEIDFSIHTMEDGTQVNTTERVCKGTHTLTLTLTLTHTALPHRRCRCRCRCHYGGCCLGLCIVSVLTCLLSPTFFLYFPFLFFAPPPLRSDLVALCHILSVHNDAFR